MTNRGHKVYVVNAKWRLAAWVIYKMGFKRRIDICHAHNDKGLKWLVPVCKRVRLPLVSTSHYFFDAENLNEESIESLSWLSRCKFHIVLNREVESLIKMRNPNAQCWLLENGTEAKEFEFRELGNGECICLGKLQKRKRQKLVADLFLENSLPISFVGPPGDEELSLKTLNQYLGEWTRETLRKRLTEFSVLVLYSEAEGQALVVVEALAAGLSVVVSKNASQNLDLSQPFIYVASDESDLISKTKLALSASDSLRKQAREYALMNFDFDHLAEKYESILGQVIKESFK